MLKNIKNVIISNFPNNLNVSLSDKNEVTVVVIKEDLIRLCNFLKYNDELKFEQLVDLCGVDYLDYGKVEWETVNSTSDGFSRAKKDIDKLSLHNDDRFAVVYHLLSYVHNIRIRLRVFAGLNDMTVPSVVDIWPTANWHEREAYDFFGFIFIGHPNLEKILTDYDFDGCPLRKDFPLTGKYQIRYDSNKGEIVREPSFIKREINSPKVIRKDFRYK
ncbi:MAG TPA: NADH-quinone oxidoreductase subunit C [Candidatus Azoamicus sp. OHIO1]